MRVCIFAVPACALAVLALSQQACRAQGAATETRTGADYDQTSVAGPHHRIVPARGARSAAAGASSGSIVEVGGGLNYFEEGQWKPSRAEFVPVEGGVHALTGQHKVRLASSLLTPGCVDVTTPEGVRLRSNVLGLGYFDPVSGRSVLVAAARDVPGELSPPNRVVYRDAFDSGVRADILYEYRLDGLAQDVVLVHDLPPPAAFGLPADSRIEVLTEFLEAPEPVKSLRFVRRETDETKRALMAEPDDVDELLSFGGMDFIVGQAFRSGPPAEELAARVKPIGDEVRQIASRQVTKQWRTIEGRKVLIEGIPHSDAVRDLQLLPAPAYTNATPTLRTASLGRKLPPSAQVVQAVPTAPMRVASRPYLAQGFVIDYESNITPGNFTFAAGQTYYVTANVGFSGYVTVQPGAVVKFAPGRYLYMYGYISCSGGTFTSWNDNTIGESITNSTGTVTGYDVSRAIWIYYVMQSQSLSGATIRYADIGLRFDHNPGTGVTNSVSGFRFEKCNVGMFANNCTVPLSSITMCDVITPTDTLSQGQFLNNTIQIDTACGPNQPPSVYLSTPTEGATYSANATVNLTAIPTDPEALPVRVEFYQNGSYLGQVGPQPMANPFTFTWSNVAQGFYSLIARAYDPFNRFGISVPVNIVIGQPANLLPIGHWRLDEGFGTTATDSSGNALHGTLAGAAVWTAGQQLGGLKLGPGNDSVTVPDNVGLRFEGDMTVSFWMRRDSEPGNWSRVVGKGSYNLRNYGLWNEPGGGRRILFEQKNGPSQWTLVLFSSTQILNGEWNHVTAVVNGSTGLLYLNGALNATASRSGTPSTSTDPLVLGYPWFDVPFSGALDDVRVFSRALTAAEIQSLAVLAPPTLTLSFNSDHSIATVSATAGAATTIRFTTDGTDPTASSSSTPPQISYPIAGPITVRARAFLGSVAPSAVSSIQVEQTANASLNPNGQSPVEYYSSSATIQPTAETGATIKYRPISGGTWLSTTHGSSIALDGIDNGFGTLEAYAYSATKLRCPTITSGTFYFRLPNPTSSVAYNGSYNSGTITLTSPAGAQVRYTTDGTLPTASSPLYSTPLAFTAPTKVLARAYKTGYAPSSYVTAHVNQLPAPRLPTRQGLLTGSLTASNALDVWLLPNLGWDNGYGEDNNALGWYSTFTYSSDVPNANYPGAFATTTSAQARSSAGVPISFGRTYTLAGWFKGLAAGNHDYAGIMNLDNQIQTIQAEDVREGVSTTLTYLTQPLNTGQTTAVLANEQVFAPIDGTYYFNFFVPLINFTAGGPILGGNQPNTLPDIYQQVDAGTSGQVHVVAIDAATHSVQLNKPYPGPSLPIGTPVIRRRAGGTYQYQLFSWYSTPLTWTYLSTTFTGFRAGTEVARLLILPGYSGGQTAFTGYEIWEGAASDRPKLHYTLDGNSAVYSQTGVAGPLKLTLDGNKPGTSSRIVTLGQRGPFYIDASIVQRTLVFQVARPLVSFEPLAGNQTRATVTCATVGATVRYTLDGTDPTPTSPVYASPVNYATTASFKAKGFKTDYLDSETVGRLPSAIFSPAAGTFSNNVTLTITAASGAQLKTTASNTNQLNSATWVLDTQGGQPGFSANGTTTENRIENGINPQGTLDKLWAAYNDAASDADGGWESAFISIDKTKAYRFSVWIKKTGGSTGTTYLGTRWGDVSNLTGNSSEVPNGNPYFWYGVLPTDEWHLLVGYVHPAGHTGTNHYSRLYNSQGTVITTCTDFKWLNTTTQTIHRAYLYYCTDTNVRQYFWNPRLEMIHSLTDPADVAFASPGASPANFSLTGNSNHVFEAMSHVSAPAALSSSSAPQVYLFQAAAPIVTFGSDGRLAATTPTLTASIRYTTDGTEPTPASSLYSSPILAPIATTRWKAFRPLYHDSATTVLVVADTDADTLPDAWEQLHFGNLTQTASADPDADGLTNQQEFQAGTLPALTELRIKILNPNAASPLP